LIVQQFCIFIEEQSQFTLNYSQVIPALKSKF